VGVLPIHCNGAWAKRNAPVIGESRENEGMPDQRSESQLPSQVQDDHDQEFAPFDKVANLNFSSEIEHEY
jgi:hypothetical protein